jgi:AcrR family transcriptional regulator
MVTESNKRIKTKRIIQEAMVDLFHRESFDEISTVQLAKEAGISRSSFYTHYRDKYDMIERYQQEFFHKVEYIFDKQKEGLKKGDYYMVVTLPQDLSAKAASILTNHPEQMTSTGCQLLTSFSCCSHPCLQTPHLFKKSVGIGFGYITSNGLLNFYHG